MVAECPSFQDWHARLGHPQPRTVSKILKDFNLPSLDNKYSPCSSCYLGKLAKLPFTSVEHHSVSPFEIIHSDVWGLSPILSNLGLRYFVHLVDDHTRFTWIFFIKNKSDVSQVFYNFNNFIERQFQTKIKAFHSD